MLETKPQQGAGKPINLCTFEPFRYSIVSKFHPLLFSDRGFHDVDMKISASPGLTAAETKDCADKLVNTRSPSSSSTSKPDMKRDLMPPRKESTGTPPTGLQQFEREGFTSLCSPAGPYKEEAYWLEKSGFKIVDLGGAGKKVYVHPSVPEDDIHPDSVVGGGMQLRVLLLDF